MPDQILGIDPAQEIVFNGPFTQIVTNYLKLTNPSDQEVCFKVKTTAPNKYCVRPNSGSIPPKETAIVAVMLQPFEYNGEERCKHKFMVQSTYRPENETSVDEIWRTVSAKDIMDSKLRVIFEMPAHPPDVGAGDDSFKTTPGGDTPNQGTEAQLRIANAEKRQIFNNYYSLQRDFSLLKERVQLAESRKQKPSIRISLIYAFVIFIMALLLGMIIGSSF